MTSNSNPFDMSFPDMQVEGTKPVVDDLEMPEDAELDFSKMAQTIQAIDNGEEESAAANEDPGPTPTTPRPTLPPAEDSQLPLGVDSTDRRESTVTRETEDDPDEDVMSLNTDINRHERSIDSLSTSIREIMKRLDLLPDLDAKIRSLSKSNDEMNTRFESAKQEIQNLRQSFNLYQSSTANKIAEVERKGAEKQLNTEVKADTSLIPPSEVHMSRSPAPTMEMNRQSDTIPHIAVDPKPVKKRAVIDDW